MNGHLIHIEGIDGSGKSTVINTCRSWAEDRGARFFDAVEFMKREQRLPCLQDLGDATGLLTAEPTFAWIGAAIREELIAKHADDRATRSYTGAETADAFSLDRLILFRRLIIPFLAGHPERIIFQDRGLCSSLAYQPLQDRTLTIEHLLARPGNAQTIAFPPTLLLLIRTEAIAALARVANRTEKRDNDVFDSADFQTQVALRYFADEVLDPFRRAGTIVAEIDGNADKTTVAHAVTRVVQRTLGNFTSI